MDRKMSVKNCCSGGQSGNQNYVIKHERTTDSISLTKVYMEPIEQHI